jgi:hypothetical protein
MSSRDSCVTHQTAAGSARVFSSCSGSISLSKCRSSSVGTQRVKISDSDGSRTAHYFDQINVVEHRDAPTVVMDAQP